MERCLRSAPGTGGERKGLNPVRDSRISGLRRTFPEHIRRTIDGHDSMTGALLPHISPRLGSNVI